MNYSAKEERYNTYSHAIGVGFGIIAGAFLLQKAIASHNSWAIVSDIVFVISMVLMYLSSTLYHAEKNQKTKALRQVRPCSNLYPNCRKLYSFYTGRTPRKWKLGLVVIWS